MRKVMRTTKTASPGTMLVEMMSLVLIVVGDVVAAVLFD
jgi:hypothetical protein